jgi:hypothetical protein
MSAKVSHTDVERFAVSHRIATVPSANTTPWYCGASGAFSVLGLCFPSCAAPGR